MTLNMKNYKGYNKMPYCNACVYRYILTRDGSCQGMGSVIIGIRYFVCLRVCLFVCLCCKGKVAGAINTKVGWITYIRCSRPSTCFDPDVKR